MNKIELLNSIKALRLTNEVITFKSENEPDLEFEIDCNSKITLNYAYVRDEMKKVSELFFRMAERYEKRDREYYFKNIYHRNGVILKADYCELY